jgi:hypothetical protein
MKTNQNKMKEPPKNQISCAEEKVQEIQSGRYSSILFCRQLRKRKKYPFQLKQSK